MKIALIGKPSVGKSTFFKAATLAEVKIASYPFTTLKSSEGVGYVRIECLEKEFNTKCNPQKGFCINGQRFVPVKLVDIPGLVEGSHRGLGMGNEFLSDVMQADAFIHIVDVSGETDIEGKPSKDHDPSKDIEFLEEELDMWYYNIFIKAWKSFARKTEMEKGKFSEAVAKQFSGLKVTEDQVKEALRKLGLDEKPTLWKDSDLKEFASILRKISKPMIIAANKIDLLNSKKNYEKLLKEFPDLMIVPCSADSELALRQAVKSDLIDYIPGNKSFIILKDLEDKQKSALDKIKNSVLDVFDGTGVQMVLNFAVFELLKYIAVFPAGASKLADSKGNILPDCFLLPPGSTALDFAYFLHTDFGKNFIKAIDARSKKALGKAYELKHRDALEIVTR